MADIIENVDIDKDTISQEELNTLFSKTYNLLSETAVTLKQTYINKLSVSKSLNIAASLLDNSIEVYRLDKTSLSKVCCLSGHKQLLTEVVFSPTEEYLLYSAGHDGIKLWDIRTSGLCVQEYKDEPESSPRAYECMDVSCSGRVLCAGAQLVLEDAYMVFWDHRKPEPLGGYWNFHTEDITQVKFHKDKAEILASGSQDGLLNIYNIAEAAEEDALTYSLNIENSVEKITWLNKNLVSCITQSNDLQLWDTSTGDRIKNYDREKIARSIKRSRADDCYVVDAYTSHDDKTIILAGSNGDDGVVLRSLNVTEKRLQPSTNFNCNKQIVRCCGYNKERDILVTAGESGLVSVWGTSHTSSVGKNVKLNTSARHNRRPKPY